MVDSLKCFLYGHGFTKEILIGILVVYFIGFFIALAIAWDKDEIIQSILIAIFWPVIAGFWILGHS